MTVKGIRTRCTEGAALRKQEQAQGADVASTTPRPGSARCVRLLSFPGLQQRGFALGCQAYRRARRRAG